MTRKTPGERIALKVRFQGVGLAEYQRVVLASDIDRAIRRAQVKAWHEGMDACLLGQAHDDNPYRGRARK